jgi:hypothetical protein
MFSTPKLASCTACIIGPPGDPDQTAKATIKIP